MILRIPALPPECLLTYNSIFCVLLPTCFPHVGKYIEEERNSIRWHMFDYAQVKMSGDQMPGIVFKNAWHV